MKRMTVCAIVLLTHAAPASQLASDTRSSGQQLAADSEVRSIVSERIKGFENRVSITVGIIGPEGRRIVSYGSIGTSIRRPATGDTVYEIGSITKVFEIFPEGDFERGSDDFFSESMDALFTFDFEKSSPSRAHQLTFSWAFLDPRRAERIE